MRCRRGLRKSLAAAGCDRSNCSMKSLAAAVAGIMAAGTTTRTVVKATAETERFNTNQLAVKSAELVLELIVFIATSVF